MKINYSLNLFRQLFLLSSLFFTHSFLFAQNDSLVFKNGNVIVGEIKSMDKGVLTIETDYSKKDFTVEWDGIKEIFSKSHFLVTLKNGQRINGTVESAEAGKKIIINGDDGSKPQTTLEEMVYLKGLKSDFWSRVHASIDAGL